MGVNRQCSCTSPSSPLTPLPTQRHSEGILLFLMCGFGLSRGQIKICNPVKLFRKGRQQLICVLPFISLGGKLHFILDCNHELTLSEWTRLIFDSAEDKTIEKHKKTHTKRVAGAPPAGLLLL